MGRHSFLQGVFLTQGSDPGVLHGRWVLHQLSHQGKLIYCELSPPVANVVCVSLY